MTALLKHNSLYISCLLFLQIAPNLLYAEWETWLKKMTATTGTERERERQNASSSCFSKGQLYMWPCSPPSLSVCQYLHVCFFGDGAGINVTSLPTPLHMYRHASTRTTTHTQQVPRVLLNAGQLCLSQKTKLWHQCTFQIGAMFFREIHKKVFSPPPKNERFIQLWNKERSTDTI